MDKEAYAYNREIIRQRLYSKDLDVVISLQISGNKPFWFRIRWSYLTEGYEAECIDTENEPLTVNEITRGHILAFFEEEFILSKVVGMYLEGEMEDQAQRLAFLKPQYL